MAAQEHDSSGSVQSHDDDSVSISGGPPDIGSEHVTNEAVSNSSRESFSFLGVGESTAGGRAIMLAKKAKGKMPSVWLRLLRLYGSPRA